MSNLNDKINKALEPHNLFYAKVSDKTYALFLNEEDLQKCLQGWFFVPTVHRTGEKTKTAFLEYLNGVDLEWVALRLKVAKKEELQEQEA
ncbi:hypothetical protein [Ralstonia insidiosa]|uniref:hypothetical protein n=1 Tax=Ralstonia insidiosa TaxID=190721 RepID=UPI000A6C7E83|nr:hypothetical protein [Ralstonia insidiosa]